VQAAAGRGGARIPPGPSPGRRDQGEDPAGLGRADIEAFLGEITVFFAGPFGPAAGDEAGFDATRPNVARVYDYLLGGCDNHQPDRQEAEALLEICPEVPVMARSNREFLGRAVTWAARQGILQFADLGSGFPGGG
jgi:hypothetical protein